MRLEHNVSADVISQAVAIMGRKPVNPIGACFDSAAAQCALGGDPPETLRICHGIGVASMPGQEGLEIAHAWLEWTEESRGVVVAFDTTWGVLTLASSYRAKLGLFYVTHYAREEFIRLWGKHNHPGPYDSLIIAVADRVGKRARGAGA